MAKLNAIRDPVLIRDWTQDRPDKPLAIGLDFGTHTGISYCYFDPTQPVKYENIKPVTIFQADLSPGKYEAGCVSQVRLRHMLHELRPSIVFYENIRNTPPTGITKYNIASILGRVEPTIRFMGSLLGAVLGYCGEFDIPCIGQDIGSIKKYATGRGNANKTDMIKAANAFFDIDLDFENYETLGTDNMADSAFVLLYGLESNSYGVPQKTVFESSIIGS